MIIFKVTAERFYFEYQHYIQQYDFRHVEWFVDENNQINMYILSNYGFGYFYSTNISTIPDMLKSLISKSGETLGIIEDKPVELSKTTFDKLRTTTLGPYRDLQA
jgi:hypothetical protein